MTELRKITETWRRSRMGAGSLAAILVTLSACASVDETLLAADAWPELPAGESAAADAGAASAAAPAPAPEDRAEAAPQTGHATAACEEADSGAYDEIGVVRFGPTDGGLQAPLKDEIVRLKARDPDLGFHLLLMMPADLADDPAAPDEATARQRIEAVASAVADLGVPTRDILFSGVTSAEVAADEVHVYPVRICRAETADAIGGALPEG